MQSYSISFKSNYRVASKMLLYICIAALSMLIISLQNFPDAIFMVKVIAIIALVINGPAIYLHFSYYLENKRWLIKELDQAIEIHKDEAVCYIIDETNLVRMNVYMSHTFIKYGIGGRLPMEEYNYVEIITKNERIIVTNLLYPNVKQLAKKFSMVKPQFHETIFASI